MGTARGPRQRPVRSVTGAKLTVATGSTALERPINAARDVEPQRGLSSGTHAASSRVPFLRTHARSIDRTSVPAPRPDLGARSDAPPSSVRMARKVYRIVAQDKARRSSCPLSSARGKGTPVIEHGLTPKGDPILSFTGRVDEAALREVHALLHGPGPSSSVVLDFSRAREIGCNVATLIAEIAHASPRVVLRGLCEHQVRILKYCGLEPGRFGISQGTPGDDWAAASDR